jgi:uncharacterized protein YndB with AHSA1/START domain
MRRDAGIVDVSHRLTAAPSKVFAAFGDASLVRRWLRPSPDVGLTVLDFDFSVGGRYRFAYHVPGGATMFVNGMFRVIEPPSMLVFSWNIEPPDEHAGIRSEVTVTLTPDGSGTHLRIRHAELTRPGAAERHEAGWRGALDHLTTMLDQVGETLLTSDSSRSLE